MFFILLNYIELDLLILYQFFQAFTLAFRDDFICILLSN